MGVLRYGVKNELFSKGGVSYGDYERSGQKG